jgi:hypothetical protein
MTAPSLANTILDTLRQHPAGAAIVTEVRAAVKSGDLETSLRQLVDSDRVLVLTEPAPDPHLEQFDLRVAALVPDGDRGAALEAARDVWGSWVRQFLANHRCQ